MRVSQKIISKILLIMLLFEYLLPCGKIAIAVVNQNELSNQTNKTNDSNIRFESCLSGDVYEATYNAGSEEKIYFKLAVNNAGYLKNGKIEISNVNFKMQNVENENIQKVTSNVVLLNQINANSEEMVLSIPIKMLNEEKIEKDNFSKVNKIDFTGIYVDKNGKEKPIKKEFFNKINWTENVDTLLAGEIISCGQYIVGDNKGALLQVKINSGVLENKFPILTTKLELNAPSIAKLKPTDVVVVANNTMGTNGKDSVEFNNTNYMYNKDTNIVEINVNNMEDNGKISWAKTQDEYIVNFIYEGIQAYNDVKSIQNEIDNLNINIKSQVQIYNNENSIIEKEIICTSNLTETKGNLIENNIIAINEIKKGYIYNNYNTTDKKETIYEVQYEVQVNSKRLINNLEINVEKEKYIDSKQKELEANGIYNRNIKISKKIFDKILGENGNIEIVNVNGEILGNINKNTPIDGNGNYIFELSKENEGVIVLKTTKIQNEGKLIFNIEKAIGVNQEYTLSEMRDFNKIKAEVWTNDKINIEENIINFNEPVTKAEIIVSEGSKMLSSIAENKNVEIRVVLDTSSYEKALYKNPVLEIELPETIEEITLNSEPLIFLEEELKIKETKIISRNGKKVVVISLEGLQTRYMDNGRTNIENDNEQNIIAKGANIVIDANVKVKKYTPTQEETIVLYYTNENSELYDNDISFMNYDVKGIATTVVGVVAPEDVILENSIKNKNGQVIVEANNIKLNEGLIDPYGASQIVSINGNITNNKLNPIKDIMVLGRFPVNGNKIAEDNSLNNNINTILQQETDGTCISVTGIAKENYRVYYSTNMEATNDLEDINNNWKENIEDVKQIKSYLLVINKEINPGENIMFSYDVNIPEKLGYERNIYETYNVFYNEKIEQTLLPYTKSSGILGLKTGTGPIVKVDLKSTANLIREGQFLKMQIDVSNSGTEAALGTKVDVELPNEIKFLYEVPGIRFGEDKENKKTFDFVEIKPGETKTMSFFVKVVDNLNFNDLETVKEFFINTATTTEKNQNMVENKKFKIQVYKGNLSIELFPRGGEEQIFVKDNILEYKIEVRNLKENQNLNNVKITLNLPEGVEFENAEIKETWGQDNGIKDGINYDCGTRILTIDFNNIQKEKLISLKLRVKKYDGKVALMAKVTADGMEEHYSNLIEQKIESVKLEISKLEVDKNYVKEADTISYKFTVTNKGNARVNNFKITNDIPEGLKFVEISGKIQNGYNYSSTAMYGNRAFLTVNTLYPNETIEITAKYIAKRLVEGTEKTIPNKFYVSANGFSQEERNANDITVEYNDEIHKDPTIDENNNTPDVKPDVTPDTKPDRPDQVIKNKITGRAWLDENKDGRRDLNEKPIEGIEVILVYRNNSNVVKDNNGNMRITKTNENGYYEFNNIENGEYLTIFLYDAGKYNVTKYQEKGVESILNSDVINMKITLNGEERYAGVTDTLRINGNNQRDIDIGMYIAEKFDFRIDKYISKVTLTTPTIGTKVYEYNNKRLVKQEVLARNVNKSNLIVEYKIVVTNEGQVSGYVKKIVDYLPENTKFNSELNKDWYMIDKNGTVYNKSLENTEIKPGESREVKLILSLNISDKNIGTNVNNNVEIYETYNEQGIIDYDSTEANRVTGEDDMANADIILTVVTGKVAMYTTLILGIMTIIVVGIIVIKKEILNKK